MNNLADMEVEFASKHRNAQSCPNKVLGRECQSGMDMEEIYKPKRRRQSFKTVQ